MSFSTVILIFSLGLQEVSEPKLAYAEAAKQAVQREFTISVLNIELNGNELEFNQIRKKKWFNAQ